jgi:hypothetical protein
MSTNNKDEHKALLAALDKLGSPTELEQILDVLAAVSKRMADRTSGKQAVTLAYWGSAARLLRQTKAELHEIRTAP